MEVSGSETKDKTYGLGCQYSGHVLAMFRWRVGDVMPMSLSLERGAGRLTKTIGLRIELHRLFLSVSFESNESIESVERASTQYAKPFLFDESMVHLHVFTFQKNMIFMSF